MIRMKIYKRETLCVFLVLCTMALYGQSNLAGTATASADSSHTDYPAAAAIDGDTADGAGWGASAIDTANYSDINIAPAATVTADESSENGPPSAAIDGDTADWTGWAVTATYDIVPHWLELRWESSQAVNRVVVYTNSAGDGDYALQGFRIQYWDGNAYQDLDTISGNTEAKIISSFDHVVTTRLRVLCEEPDAASSWYRIGELEVYTAFKLDPHWLDLSWASPQTINRIVLFTDSAENGAYALRAYDIQYWDGAEYTSIVEVIGNEASKLSSSFLAVTTTGIRIFCREPDRASMWYRINELEVYYDAPEPVETPVHWLELNWDSIQTMNRIELYTNSAGDGAYALRGYEVQYWADDAWQRVASVTSNTEAQVSSTFTSVSTDKIRIYCTDPDQASKWYRVNELEVYDDTNTGMESLLAEKEIESLWVYMDAITSETVIMAPVDIGQVQLYSMNGILVYQDLNLSGTKTHRISSVALPPGVYVVVVNRAISEKFIIN